MIKATIKIVSFIIAIYLWGYLFYKFFVPTKQELISCLTFVLRFIAFPAIVIYSLINRLEEK